MVELRTPRLVLRQWKERDHEPFAALNADPEVMHYFPALLTREQSDALAERARAEIEQRGWGLWAVEVLDEAGFIGFVGLAVPQFDAHFTPAVEVGWRLARDRWGNGYATEGARAAVAFGFDELGLDEIVSFTSGVNERSRRVMERLGMTHDETDDFDHPSVSSGFLRRHVLYRLKSSQLSGNTQAHSPSGGSRPILGPALPDIRAPTPPIRPPISRRPRSPAPFCLRAPCARP